MFTITEASKKLNISRVTIYSKIKDKTVKQHVKNIKGKKYITQEGIEVIDKLIDRKEYNVNFTNECRVEENKAKNNSNYNSGDEAYKTLQNTINHLNKQLEIKDRQIENKDKQIESKDRQIESLNRITEQMQFLLNEEQKKTKFLLGGNKKKEDHLEDIEIELKENKMDQEDIEEMTDQEKERQEKEELKELIQELKNKPEENKKGFWARLFRK